MDWKIDFISENDFKEHVRQTILKYGETLTPYDVQRFNSNIIDPVKMIFDKMVFGKTWAEIIDSEIFRQRDKSNANAIGYFHQRIFDYIEGCHVPANGKEGGWDVIVEEPEGYAVAPGNIVHRIYVEMKNKHNTMNSASAGKTYMKMQNQLLKDDDCVCFLVEAIAKESQNIVWQTSVDGMKVHHTRIRRVSLDRFYEVVTGEQDAFLQLCMVLPDTIQVVLDEGSAAKTPHDTVFEELRGRARKLNISDENLSFLMSIYMLGFSNYDSFRNLHT